MAGKVDVVFGLQEGDEGKGKMTDILLNSNRYTINFRFQGGDNAGHTLFRQGRKTALHQIPSGVFHPNVSLRTGSGCVLSPFKIHQELADIAAAGGDLNNRYFISNLVSIIQPGYILQDKFNGAKIGTTGNGIGPTYAARATRHDGEMLVDLRFGQVLDDPLLARDIMTHTLEKAIAQIGGRAIVHSRYPDFTNATLIQRTVEAILQLEEYGEQDSLWLTKQIEKDENALAEGAQAWGLDLINGIPPYTTSNSTCSDYAFVGGDISAKFRGKVYGVAKAIQSRVGNGPFVSEWGGAESEAYCNEERGLAHTQEKERLAHPDPTILIKSGDPMKMGIGLRMLSNEYGASTGRPRRIGSFNTVQLRHAAKRNGVDGIFINKIDDLRLYSHSPARTIPITTGYELDGKKIDYIPVTEDQMRRINPIITHTPAWDNDLRHARKREDLPFPVIYFLAMIEYEIKCPIMGIGVGPNSDEYVLLKEL